MIEVGAEWWSIVSKWILGLLIVIFGWLKLDNTSLKNRMKNIENKRIFHILCKVFL